jgi:hypothetical protein
MLDLSPFPSYQIDARLKELRWLGLSSPVVRLAMFDLPDPGFGIRCDDVGPPCPEWRDQQPAGPPVSRLWCYRDTVTGARLNGGWADRISYLLGFPRRYVEFIKFKPSDPAAGYTIIADSEQGLLANLFADMIGDYHDTWKMLCMDSSPGDFTWDEYEKLERSLLIEAAENVGFRYFHEIESFWRAHRHQKNYGELLAAYTRSIR